MADNGSAMTNATAEHEDLSYLYILGDFCKWANAFIIVLGLVTNSLTILVLSRSKVGSITTRIILLALAATDVLVMVLELFLHYIPTYWKWFPIFYDNTCGVAELARTTVQTSASWYITLVTIERFVAVWFPLKARCVCTKKTIITLCICIPLICLALYAFLLFNMVPKPDGDYIISCSPKTSQGIIIVVRVWIIAYFFVPAVIIVVLNGAIVWKLRMAADTQRKMINDCGAEYRLCSPSTDGNERKVKPFNKSASCTSLRKATVLVIVASVTFVVLMIPRGVSTILVMDEAWGYETKAERILDWLSYLLQYLNHATNFFIYIIANIAFRRQLMSIFKCESYKRSQSSYPLTRYANILTNFNIMRSISNLQTLESRTMSEV